MPSDRVERAMVAFTWLATAGVVVTVGAEWARWGVAAAFTAVTLGTGGRPALVMDRVIELEHDRDRPVRRRRMAGLIVLLVAICAVAALTTDW